ncbi:hypothetical protein CNR22_00545 [Sphingobacteriaceae bacterium]|nr:hypothetical protein CNR22_00545 [Sphingobacteriaceae bacterium]
MKRLLTIVLFASMSLIFHSHVKVYVKGAKSDKRKVTAVNAPIALQKFSEALAFCRKQKLDTTIAFFSDMSLHSGKKRFYIADLQQKKILCSSLVCHGMGKYSTPELPVFSNEPGSYCSSLGKYKTGKRAFSNWGIGVHYKMYGLEKTNSNAFKRIVVLHSYDPVPENEIFPQHLPMGWSQGCPVISNETMREADKILQKKKKPLLIWLYN